MDSKHLSRFDVPGFLGRLEPGIPPQGNPQQMAWEKMGQMGGLCGPPSCRVPHQNKWEDGMEEYGKLTGMQFIL